MAKSKLKVVEKKVVKKKSTVKKEAPKKATKGQTGLSARKSTPTRSKSTSKKSKVATKPKKRISAKEKATQIYETIVLEHRENGRKLSRSILRRWRVHMPLDDVDSIVDLALCEAAQRFCPSKGASFMTFFFYHLRGHLVRAVARATQINNFQTTVDGDKDSENESESTASSYSQYIHLVDQELYSQKDQETPEEIVLRREKIGVCRTALDSLDSLEKAVLERSYSDDEALVAIASSLGYSRCHISRVKKSAMIKLKSNLLDTAHFDRIENDVVDDNELNILRAERPVRRKTIPTTKRTKPALISNKRVA